MKPEIIIVTAAYGHQKVAELGGQQALLPIVAEAGGDGVEIRRELLAESELQRLPQLAEAIAEHRLKAFYSVPDALFADDGAVNPQLDRYLQEAEQLRAQRLKLSLGAWRPDRETALETRGIRLVVENDQTEYGRLDAIAPFFARQHATSGMTFDIGNWLWTGDDALAAARLLARHVSYIHVKAAIPHGDSWRAIALDEADNGWRELLKLLPGDVPRGIEFPLQGDDLTAVTRHYVDLLREE
ncbi:sugar phosphate isomerase/epimerase family protein [Mixta hanseatica]|uniref:Sugar phosphate isomerase/epimerase n=1 Tax=Mixta hanseatica TaxID=2872648 RepID=A0ABY4R6X1_9GAMM|nr:sugar phosphate isomerase/epimerase [Mixta hanseatica]UQY44151.1 sugar phosphate isomerase/epimerase [Mixta hanseatica]